ncbi:MAG: MBL fold metallo-hydrolase [Methanosarcinaceae archaeon]
MRILQLDFKGGCREVGRSAMLVNEEILVDYGMKPGEMPLYPMDGLHPKSVIISHGHLDHCGVVPSLMDLQPEVFMTPITFDFANALGRDTLKIAEARGMAAPYNYGDLQRMQVQTNKIDTGVEFHTHNYTAQFYDAGHIPGAASVYLESPEGDSLFYTGDINTLDTRLVPGAEDHPEADTLVIESTYFAEDHSPRKETETAFIDSLNDTLDIGGNVIIPAFAIGRTQEILMLLDEYDIHTYVDGMGVAMYKLMLHHPDYLKDPARLKKAFGNASIVKGHRRKRVPLENSVIVTTAGMLNGGPVLYYLNKLYKDPKTKIMITGYQVEGTNGRMAIDNGIIDNDGVIQQLNTKIEQYDFSAHCGDRELKGIVRSFCDNGTETVFTMHGENSQQFAQWVSEEIGVDAYAPANGERYTIG